MRLKRNCFIMHKVSSLFLIAFWTEMLTIGYLRDLQE